MTLDDLVDRARRAAEGRPRTIIGIAGPPGAGKSTVSAAISSALPGDAAVVSMDGFHLADQELERQGIRQRKGSPDTFDVAGYVSLLSRLRSQRADIVYAPLFDRANEVSVGSAIPVHPGTPLVITEGNYLLVEQGGWAAVHACLDEVWFLDLPDEVRRQRLVDRRRAHGESLGRAQRWVDEVDEANARLVNRTRHRATLVVELAAGSD